MPISHHVSYLELRRAYSRYCISHPNITAVLGVCIQQATAPAAWSADDDMPGSAPGSAPVSAPTSRAATPQRPSHGPRNSFNSPFRPSAPAASTQGCSLPSTQPAAAASADDGSFGSGLAGLGSTAAGVSLPQHQVLWVVEEAFGEESLLTRLERGLLSWQQVVRIGSDICKALAFLQDLRPTGGMEPQTPAAGRGADDDTLLQPQPANLLLSPHALRSLVLPANVQVDSQQCKLSMLPVLLNQLEAALGPLGDGGGSLLVNVGSSTLGAAVPGSSGQGSDTAGPATPAAPPPLHCDMAYTDPMALFASLDSCTPTSFYAFGVVLLQLLTEQGPLGLLSAVREAISSRTLTNLVPRLPATADMAAWAEAFATLAMRCTVPGGVASLESEVLPSLEELGAKLSILGSAATLSWEQVEEMLMLPLQPRPMGAGGPGALTGGADAVHRRWVRTDFRMRRKMFLLEVAKLAADAPVHKLEVGVGGWAMREGLRCPVTAFAGWVMPCWCGAMLKVNANTDGVGLVIQLCCLNLNCHRIGSVGV